MISPLVAGEEGRAVHRPPALLVLLRAGGLTSLEGKDCTTLLEVQATSRPLIHSVCLVRIMSRVWALEFVTPTWLTRSGDHGSFRSESTIRLV